MISGASLLICFVVAQSTPLYEAEFIFPPNDKHNHGSSIVETAGGDLLTCWFHGSGERNSDDVMVQGARRRAGSKDWSEPFLMADTPDLPDCNPVLFIDPRGVLWLIWITVQDNQWGGSLLKYRTAANYTKDGPPEWDWQDVIHARPEKLEELYVPMVDNAKDVLAPLLAAVPDFAKEIDDARDAATNKLRRRLGWMTRLHPIMTSPNRMMLGLYSDVFNCSLAGFTEDWGKTWTFSQPILDPAPNLLGNIQPSFVQKKDGAIMAFMRDNGIPNYVRTATSSDNGVTWSKLGTLEIRNPGSSVECIALKNGHWILVCNDTTDGRHLLSVYVSEDEGTTWKLLRRLEEVEKGKGSFSYPSVIQAVDGSIHCTYSYSGNGITGSTIKHVRFMEQ
ncbi:MAG TPA: exo-alpha-sialidase [Candidatus Hydrogenedentes bacterium]|nr:exo-alpha-sialidase [Candidatus Hydrogenedentota bacterium]